MSEDDFVGSLVLLVCVVGFAVCLWSLVRFVSAVIFGRWWLYFHLQQGHPDCHDGCDTCDRLRRRINGKPSRISIPKATAIKVPTEKPYDFDVNNMDGWAD